MASLPGCSAVLANAQAGAYAAAAHLFEQGHQRLLYFCRPGNTPFGFHQDQLCPGYQQACLDRGLDPALHLVPIEIGEELWRLTFLARNWRKFTLLDTLKPGFPALSASAWKPVRQALRTHGVTAIVAPNDAVAIVLRYMLAQDGLRVPEDISLVGFDDTDPMYDDNGRNMLTSVRLPLRTLGRKAAQTVIGRITGKLKQEVETMVPSTLVLRRSTLPRTPGV
jgi:DNA-binding LacI/PurR family transcriptional regulator